jgi:hypothetical protein
LVPIGTYELFPQLVRLVANERHRPPACTANRNWGDAIKAECPLSSSFPLRSSRLDLSLLIEGQLLSQEQDLRAQGCARAEQEAEKKKSVRDQIGDQVKQRIQ